GGGPHKLSRLPSHRCDRHRGSRGRELLSFARGFRGRFSKRLHEICRRLSLWARGGSGGEHSKDARPRPGGARGAPELQVPPVRKGPGSGRLRPGEASLSPQENRLSLSSPHQAGGELLPPRCIFPTTISAFPSGIQRGIFREFTEHGRFL